MNRAKNRKLRLKLAHEATWICVYCRQQTRKETGYWNTATIDHVKARSRGGSDQVHNLVHACLRCNTLKKNLPVLEFLGRLDQLGEETRGLNETQRTCPDQLIHNVADADGGVQEFLSRREQNTRARQAVLQAATSCVTNPYAANTWQHRLFNLHRSRQQLFGERTS